jgi:hypothetical protein
MVCRGVRLLCASPADTLQGREPINRQAVNPVA